MKQILCGECVLGQKRVSSLCNLSEAVFYFEPQLELEEGAVGLGVNHPSCWENPEVRDFLHLERKQDTQKLFMQAGSQTPSNGDLSEVIQEPRGSAHLPLIPNKRCSNCAALRAIGSPMNVCVKWE